MHFTVSSQCISQRSAQYYSYNTPAITFLTIFVQLHQLASKVHSSSLNAYCDCSIAPICKQGPQAKPPRSSLIGKVRTELKATKPTEATKQYPKPVTMVLPAYVYKKPDSNVPTSLPPAEQSNQLRNLSNREW